MPRDIAARAIHKVCHEMKLGVDGQPALYLDITHLPAARMEEKLGGVLEIYRKFVGQDPTRVPMKIFPAMHYTMGGLWVDVLRTPKPGAASHWEHFEVAYQPNMNVITLLLEIRKHPVTREGRPTEPVVWECNCLEEVCGACSMVINGLPRQACSTLVDDLKEPVRLQPLSKFPVVRDLMVDRGIMFEHLKRVKAWIAIDGTHDLGHGPKMSKEDAATGYELSRCMTCGCCMEGCPQVNSRTGFIGPAAIAQARLFSIHPTGKMWEDDRLAAIMRDGGINECGNAQNCERVCPKHIPLLSSLAEMNRKTIISFFRNLLRR